MENNYFNNRENKLLSEIDDAYYKIYNCITNNQFDEVELDFSNFYIYISTLLSETRNGRVKKEYIDTLEEVGFSINKKAIIGFVML